MAHFAELDNNNKVKRVLVIDNENIIDNNGNESEAVGKDFCLQFGPGPWVQTSYNGKFRKNFAGVGATYDTVRDAFIPPQPRPDTVLNEETCRWELPNNQ